MANRSYLGFIIFRASHHIDVEHNLSKQPQMLQLRQETASKLKAVTELRSLHEKLFLEYQTLASKYSPQNIKENLKLEALKSDEESEKIADNFLNGKLDVESFLSEYLEQRAISHKRKAKEERLGFQLRELEKAGF
ncbi:vacuolar protein sorting-associated protein 37A [Bemisia tabaci]|uniref:vacuolar protein sorting-associated protein 37A n=1 Tax=Bemisia tabaci TaxID=7038 RepID=UPI003B27DE4F